METLEVAGLVDEARERIAGRIRRTPVDSSAWLDRLTGAQVGLKLENQQRTGSFKLRGAMNRVLALSADERERGVVAASTGNHGAGVACACSEIEAPCRVFVPDTASPGKLETIEGYGAELRVEGSDGVVAERAARAFAENEDIPYVSPYNDPLVIAGQGTIGAELVEQWGSIDSVFISLGGGGLLSGVAAYLKSYNPDLEVVACSAQNSAVMKASLEAGEILDLESLPTLSDGTAGGVESGAITFPLCGELIDRHALVSEDAIAHALRELIDHQHLLVEGSAAMAVAALLASGDRYQGKRVVVLLCGGNITVETLRQILSG